VTTARASVPGRARSYEPGDEVVIQELFELCFPGSRRSLERWRWRFLAAPEQSDMLMLERTDTDPPTVVGHTALERGRFWIDGRERPVVTGADLMLHPGHRGNRLTVYLWKPLVSLYEEVDVNLAFPAEITVHIAGNRLRGVAPTMLGRLPQWLWWGSVAAVRRDRPSMPWPAAAALVAACRGSAWAARSTKVRVELISAADLDGNVGGELDELADSSARWAPCIRRRATTYLRWRFCGDPEREWSIAVARDAAGALTGYVAYGHVGGDGRIADLLAADARSQRVLVAHALRALGRSRSSLELLDPRPWSDGSVRRTGMLRRGEGPEVMIMHAAPAVKETAEVRSSWYLTIGDSDHV
jgi:hypothetical protein